MDKHEARAAILAHAETIDWSVSPTLEEQNATLRAQLAEVTRERDEALKLLRRIDADLGRGVHTGFRHGSDHPDATAAWRAIDDMPMEEWVAVLRYFKDGVGLTKFLESQP